MYLSILIAIIFTYPLAIKLTYRDTGCAPTDSLGLRTICISYSWPSHSCFEKRPSMARRSSYIKSPWYVYSFIGWSWNNTQWTNGVGDTLRQRRGYITHQLFIPDIQIFMMMLRANKMNWLELQSVVVDSASVSGSVGPSLSVPGDWLATRPCGSPPFAQCQQGEVPAPCNSEEQKASTK